MALADYINAFVLNPWSSWPSQAFPANSFRRYSATNLQAARAAWGLFELVEARDAQIRLKLAGTLPGIETVTDPNLWTELRTESNYNQYKFGQYLHAYVCPKINWTSQRNLVIPDAGTTTLVLALCN